MSRLTLSLLVISVLLSAYAFFFENTPAPWERVGRVFRDVEAADILEIEISRPRAAADAGLGVDPRPIRIQREGQPASWWIVEPIHFEAFHPRAATIAYELSDVVRVAEVGPDTEAYARGPEIKVRFKTRWSGDKEIEIGADHPDASLDFCYARSGGEIFVTRKDFRKQLTVTLEELRSRTLVPVSMADAALLSVSGEARLEKTVERVGDSNQWRLRKPLDALADREIMEALLIELNAWKVSSFVKDDARSKEDLAPYGLAEPRATVAVRHKDGSTVLVEIGAELPGKAEGKAPLVYLKHAGQPFVFTAGSEPLERLFKDAEAYRSRYIFDLGLDEIVRLRAEGGGQAFEVGSTSKGAWEVKDPATGEVLPGDAREIQNLLASLRKLLIQKFVGADVKAEDAGLSPPWGRLEFETTGQGKHELLLGGPSRDPDFPGLEARYAARPGEPGFYIIFAPVALILEQGAQALRKRDISLLDPALCLEFEVREGSRSWTLGRIPGEPWALSSDTPVLPKKELDPSKVDDLLLALRSDRFRVDAYLPGLKDYGAHGLELTAPRKAVVFLNPESAAGFRKLVIGDRVLESSPEQVRGRVDAADVPPFLLAESSVPRSLDALLLHLKDITGK